MIRSLLNRLAARILRDQVKGVFVSYLPEDGTRFYHFESFYGDGWQISVPANSAKFTRLPASTLDQPVSHAIQLPASSLQARS